MDRTNGAIALTARTLPELHEAGGKALSLIRMMRMGDGEPVEVDGSTGVVRRLGPPGS